MSHRRSPFHVFANIKLIDAVEVPVLSIWIECGLIVLAKPAPPLLYIVLEIANTR
jgi:hypothetical protein